MPRHPCRCSARPLVQMSSDPAGFLGHFPFRFVISKSNACSDSGQVIDHCTTVLLVALNKCTLKHLAEYEQIWLLETLQNL